MAGKKVIINRAGEFGTINGVAEKSSRLLSLVIKSLKSGSAKKIVDTDDILMYEIN